MWSNNRIHSIYTYLKRKRYHNYYDMSLLQLLLCKNIVNLKECVAATVLYNRKWVIHQMGGCNWNCELPQYLSNTFQIHCIYEIHGCKCSFKKTPIH